MEAVHMFQNLPESEKAKFFEMLRNDSSIRTESLGRPSLSPEKLALDNFLETLIGGSKFVNEESIHAGNTQSPESRKKQKTLDGWLIKGGRTSTDKNKVSDCPMQKSVVNLNAGNDGVSESSTVSLAASDKDTISSDVSVTCSTEVCISEPKLSNSRKERDALLNSDILPVTPNGAYSLRSKRKLSNSPSPSPSKNNYQTTPSPSKTAYNLRAKRKVTKKMEELTGSSYTARKIIGQDLADNHIEKTISKDLAQAATSSSQYEAFCKVKIACSQVGLDVFDILQHENVQKLLSDFENNMFNNGVVLIGRHESNDQKVLPVVYVQKSESNDIYKIIEKIQEQNLL